MVCIVASLLLSCASRQTTLEIPAHIDTLTQASYTPFIFNVGLYTPQSFYTFKPPVKGAKTDKFDLQWELGSQLHSVLPDFFSKRFKSVALFKSTPPDTAPIDYLFVPQAFQSHITIIDNTPPDQFKVQITLHLKIVVHKGGSAYDTIRAKETRTVKLSRAGKSSTDKQKLQQTYLEILTSVFSSTDTYLLTIMNADCM